MKKLLCFFRGYRKETVLAPLFKLAEVLLELIVPLVVATIIDKGIGEGLGTAYILRRCLFRSCLAHQGWDSPLSPSIFPQKRRPVSLRRSGKVSSEKWKVSPIPQWIRLENPL